MHPKTRERLVGVLLLMLLVAILSPLVLRSPQEVRVALEMDIPEAPDMEATEAVVVVTEDEVEDAAADIVEAGEEVVEAAEDARETAPLDVPSGDEAATPSGWMVQVASFSSEQSARQLASQLRDKDYSAFVRQADQGGEPLFRVYAGPELQREDAQRLRDRLASDQRFKLPGFIVPYEL